ECGPLMRQQAEQLGSIHRVGCVDVEGPEVYQMAQWHCPGGGQRCLKEDEWRYRSVCLCWARHFCSGCRGRRCATRTPMASRGCSPGRRSSSCWCSTDPTGSTIASRRIS